MCLNIKRQVIHLKKDGSVCCVCMCVSVSSSRGYVVYELVRGYVSVNACVYVCIYACMVCLCVYVSGTVGMCMCMGLCMWCLQMGVCVCMHACFNLSLVFH